MGNDLTERRQTLEALRSSEERYRAVADTALDGIISANSRGEILYLNKAAERMFGYSASEVLGQPLQILMPDRFREAHRKGLARFASTGEVRVMGKTVELVGRRKDGSEFPIELSLANWRVAEDLFFTGIVRDITERKRSEEKFRGLLESAPDSMIIVNPEGNIELINRQTEKLFGYTRDELLGKPVEILVPLRLRDKHREQRTGYFAAPRARPMGMRLELRGVRKDGTELPVEISLSPLQTEGGVRVSAAIRDLTERKRLEQARAHAERLATIGAMAAKLAHEIRNPLGAARLNLDTLRELAEALPGHDGEVATRMRSMLGWVDEEMRRLQRITDGYLRFARLPGLQRERVDLGEVLAQGLGFAQSLFDATGVVVQRDLASPPTALYADREQLWEAVFNILRNALEAMPQGGILRLTTVREDSEAVLRITDNGPGMTAEQREKIFHPFFSTKEGGTGLGLAVVRQIINEHGGRIECQSEPGKGTVFTIRLPLAKEA